MKQQPEEYDIANKRFDERLNQKTNQVKKSESGKLVKHLQVMRVEIDIQRAETIQLIQAVGRKHYEKLEKASMPF